MTLAALIRKRETGEPANANPANPANDGQAKAGTLATLATLALAKPETATAWRWLMHYPDGSVEVRFSPEVTHGAALAACPGAIAAEPIPETSEREPTEGDPRRGRVLAMLADRPGTRYAVLVNDPDTDPVLITVGIRDLATFDMAIPKAKFDPFRLMGLIDRYRNTVH